MRFDLIAMARRARNPRRRSVRIRDIVLPAILATDLYAGSYRPIITTLQRYVERLTTEYERSLAALTTDSAGDLNDILNQMASDLSRLVLTLTPGLRSWLLRVEQWQRGKWIGAVLSASGVDLSTLLTIDDVRQTLETYLEWNASLIKDVGDQARQRISSAVFAGLQNRTPAREVAKSIREATGFARDRSLRIASDQLSKVTSALADERRKQAGLTVWEWKHSGKLHPRVRHKERDGNYYSDDKAMIGRTVDGKVVAEQPEANDLPGRPPFCGCRSLSVLVFD